MSDFLSRLAERALGATPPLQPLVGSRFAAPAEPADGFVEETVEGEGSAPPLRRGAADASPAAQPQPVMEAMRRADEAGPVLVPTPAPAESEGRPAVESPAPPPVADRAPSPDRAMTAEDARAVASSTRPFAHDAAALYARQVAPSARASELDPPLTRTSDRVPAGRAEVSQRAEPLVETVRDGELLMPASAPPDRPAFASTAPAREDGSTRESGVEARRRVAGDAPGAAEPARQTGEPADDREPREHASDALLMPVARRRESSTVDGDRATGPRTDARQPWAEHAAARVEKERPVVQVTIGRIEVRAVHPPAAPQPARGPGWTPPVLSLDEYLKREGGR